MDRIKVLEAKKRKKLSRKDIADFIKVTPTCISLWLNNVREPTKKHRPLICKILGMTEGELFGGISKETLMNEIKSHHVITVTGIVLASKKLKEKIAPRKSKKISLPNNFSIKNSRALICKGDSMEPLCKDGDIILYSEDKKIKNNNLVIVEIEGHGKFFKRYKNISHKEYPMMTSAAFKKLQRRIKKGQHICMFTSANNSNDYPPLLCCSDEIISIRKVAGILYK